MKHQLQATITESTTGADASVEVPKLHNIKLLIASFYTHIDYNYHDEHFCIRITRKLKEWVMIDHYCC